MLVSRKPVYVAAAIAAIALLYLGFAGYGKWQEHKANAQSQQAQQHHEEGINQAGQGQSASSEGDAAIQRTKELQGKLAVADAEVERLKAILAHHPVPSQPPVAGPGNIPSIHDSSSNEMDVKDKLIDAQGKEIGLLKIQVIEYKSAADSYKDYGDHYKKAYEEECKSHNLDNIAHQASLAAEKARTLKVGIFSFGGGAAAGWLLHR